MVRGLRVQLCLWHGGLLALTLLALAGFTRALLVRVLHSRADAALLEQADSTGRQVAATLLRMEARTGRPVSPQELPRFLSNDLRTWGRYIQIVDPRGNIVERSDGLQTHPLPVGAAELRQGLAGRETRETKLGLGEHPVRIVTVPVRMGPRIPYLVQAGASLEGVEAALQRAGWILAVLTPSVFVIALAGGWLLLGRALGRVDVLTRTALDIQGSNLRRRIEHHGADDEIGRLAQAFDQMIARLDQSFQQVRRFSSDASHELKTPLTAIRGEAEVALMSDLSPAEYRESLKSILESSERMSEIVESLLLLSRAESGHRLLRQEPVDLGELTLRVVDELEPQAVHQQVSLEVLDIQDVTVPGDLLWLRQVVTNLVGNGIKYTPGGGRVCVSLCERDGAAELTVRDNGIGISEAHLPHIFDRFYRVDEGRARAAGGSGLGLSITRWAVEAHGGTVAAESRPGEGSTFRVRLPLTAAGEGAAPISPGAGALGEPAST